MFVCFLNQSLSPLLQLCGAEGRFMGNRMSTCISSQGASALWTQALCPRQWQKKGGLTLTCQKTRCQTHSEGKAECTRVNEQLVPFPRNDQAEAVTLKHQAAEVTGVKKHCLHRQEGLIRRTSVLFLVVYSPVIFLQSHSDMEEGKGGIPRSLAYLNPQTPRIMY